MNKINYDVYDVVILVSPTHYFGSRVEGQGRLKEMNRSITTTSLRSHTAVASGFLHKLTHNGTPFARWHQRYYVLYTDGLLRSYKSSRSRSSNRVIHVGRKCLRVRFGTETRNDECSRWPKGCPRERCFSVINSDREFHFYCESEREFAVWQDNLLSILGRLGSAHTSYVERRGSKMNGVASWLDDKSEDDSSIAPTPASSRKLGPAMKKERADISQDLVDKESDGSEGYDAVGPAVHHTACDSEEGESEDGLEEQQLINEDDESSRKLAERGSLNEEEMKSSHKNLTDKAKEMTEKQTTITRERFGT